MSSTTKYIVAVIGAGPAGLYASKQLADEGVQVVLINRDIKPGGLAEYGIYKDKHKMKAGLRKQFRRILDSPEITYYGNVTIGEHGDLTLEELETMGFQALLVTVGAQGTKWLGLPGEDLQGVYHAKDIVYHYNDLPPFSQQDFAVGRHVVVIGVGNVMIDIAHWLIRDLKVDEVIAVARRGPAEVKFTKKEMEHVARNLDLQALDTEIKRVAGYMREVDQDPQAAKEFILSALPKAEEPVSETRFRFEFLASPSKILGDEDGKLCGLEVEDTKLIPRNGDTKAERLGTTRVLDVDTVIFCIGDKVDDDFGLPIEWNEFVKCPTPRYPINEVSYEAFDPQTGMPLKNIFVAGWSREASSGLVGVARKDGEMGAMAVVECLKTLQPLENPGQVMQKLESRLRQLDQPVVTKQDWQRLELVEQAEAENRGLEAFKFKSNEQMLAVIKKQQV